MNNLYIHTAILKVDMVELHPTHAHRKTTESPGPSFYQIGLT